MSLLEIASDRVKVEAWEEISQGFWCARDGGAFSMNEESLGMERPSRPKLEWIPEWLSPVAEEKVFKQHGELLRLAYDLRCKLCEYEGLLPENAERKTVAGLLDRADALFIDTEWFR